MEFDVAARRPNEGELLFTKRSSDFHVLRECDWLLGRLCVLRVLPRQQLSFPLLLAKLDTLLVMDNPLLDHASFE